MEDKSRPRRPTDEQEEMVARAALREAFKVLLDIKIDVNTGDDEHTNLITVLKAYSAAKAVERAAEDVLRQNDPESLGYFLELHHIVASALWAATTEFVKIEDVHPYAKVSLCWLYFASASVMMNSYESLEGSFDNYPPGYSGYADTLLKILKTENSTDAD
jgi:hypothetical protein